MTNIINLPFSEHEYEILMKEVFRFLKEENIYKPFCNITLKGFDYNKERHRKAINQIIDLGFSRRQVITSFFGFEGTLSARFILYGSIDIDIIEIGNKWAFFSNSNPVINDLINNYNITTSSSNFVNVDYLYTTTSATF